ncbi:hypothetical protein HAP48_0004405 [Bradyrhizobium septentrionale]|uniref:Uncharacterized protein n=1 Tax=Bradyrhizobium septentrionale TaxID=1404411 RepID=A0A973W5V6_9BRAD|nr:hypothetical protein [Bradyrhizobium septentrionale]UGY16787.1 hypothetical protein HAP48_0004405 [Bradyrhizobium septentrionale]
MTDEDRKKLAETLKMADLENYMIARISLDRGERLWREAVSAVAKTGHPF